MSPRQKKLFDFLRDRERRAKAVSVEQMSQGSGLKQSTIRDYISKGYLGGILSRKGKASFIVTGTVSMTEQEFHRAISQSNVVKDLGHGFRSMLAKPLVLKSRDNMTLALELYNRPSLLNRIDGFTMLFCAAWDQLLKARTCEQEGDESVFRPAKDGRPRETKSLRDLLRVRFEAASPVRRNLERIVDLRDQATHLLLPELLSSASRLFQAGVSNFADYFRDLCGQGFLPAPTAGLLTLVVDEPEPNRMVLRSKYGPNLADQILALLGEIATEVRDSTDRRFAIPIDYKLVFSKNPSDADISVSSVSDAADKTVVVVEKPVDPTRRCPHSTEHIISLVNKQLSARMLPEDLRKRLSHNGTDRDSITTHDFQCIAHREKWKNSNNEFHYWHELSGRRSYSDRAVEVAVERITTTEGFLHSARQQYRVRGT